MAGTKIGGLRASESNKKRHGDDFYKNIGATGGKAKVPKGFAKNRKLAMEAGRKGGLAKKPRKAKNEY